MLGMSKLINGNSREVLTQRVKWVISLNYGKVFSRRQNRNWRVAVDNLKSRIALED